MERLVQEIIEFIDNESLLMPSDKVLVAVSAGVDSVVLAHILDETGYRIGIIHANFQLRAEESDLDEILVRNIADRLSVPFYSKKFSTNEYARKRGISTEMAARELRYQWFEEIRKSHGYQAIALAHHLNDVVETILLNFTRGTGIAGFHGILPKRGYLIRPLLSTSKEQIVEYATAHEISWREDQSNQSADYQRNLIRNQVVPVLKKINPNLEHTTGTTIEIIRTVEQQYQESLDQLRQRIYVHDTPHIRIRKSDLIQLKPALLADLIAEYGFNLDQCKSLLEKNMEGTGKIYQSDTHILNVDREELIISPANPDRSEGIIEQDGGLTKIGARYWETSIHPAQKYSIESQKRVAAFDFDKIQFPLKVRCWRAGDRFHPLGMNQQKKLSDFLIDSKVPLNYKTSVQVLLSGEEVIWVAGYRIDERYKITEKTKTVLEIKMT